MGAGISKEPWLAGPRVVVRLARRQDVDAVVAYYRENDDHLARYESPKPRAFLDPRFWRAELESRRDACRRGWALRLFAFDRTGDLTGRPDAVVGVVGLTSIVRGAFYGATLGYSVAARLEGRGVMREALELVIAHAFSDLNLHRIMANHSPRNERSARLLRRLGFRREGYAKRYLFVHGAWEDHVLNALENPDWRVPRGFLRHDEEGRVTDVAPETGGA